MQRLQFIRFDKRSRNQNCHSCGILPTFFEIKLFFHKNVLIFLRFKSENVFNMFLLKVVWCSISINQCGRDQETYQSVFELIVLLDYNFSISFTIIYTIHK